MLRAFDTIDDLLGNKIVPKDHVRNVSIQLTGVNYPYLRELIEVFLFHWGIGLKEGTDHSYKIELQEKEILIDGQVHTVDKLEKYLGRRQWSDYHFETLTGSTVGPEGIKWLAWMISREVAKDCGKLKKAIVVDADDTLWKGSVGEIGWEGIGVSAEPGPGYGFFQFQKYLKQLTSRGVPLILLSKNDNEVIQNTFKKRKDMPLKKEDFVTIIAGLEEKTKLLTDNWKEINLLPDSLVFIDDKPFEVESMKYSYPEVWCLPCRQYPQAWMDDLKIINLFNMQSFDKAASRSRVENIRPKQYSQSINESLGTVIDVIKVDESNVKRFIELANKTNQFHLNGQFTKDLGSDREHVIVTLRDRMGELGVVGGASFSPNGNIDRFFVSCRAFDRGVEQALVNYIKKSTSQESLNFNYRDTKKNKAMSNFLKRSGIEV